MSFSEKLGKRTFPTRDVTICLDAALGAERDALMSVRGPQAKKQLAELEERMRDSLVTIRVTGVPVGLYVKLQGMHPRRDGRAEVFNPETFYPDFVYRTASIVEGDELEKLSELPRAQWDEFAENLTTAELNALAQAVHDTNTEKVETGFLSRGSATTEPS